MRLQGARPAGPPPRPRTEPVTVQRRVSATGVITVCRQRISLGRVHAGRTIRVHVSEHTLAVELDGETRTIRRTTSRPVVVAKGSRPHQPRRHDVNGTLGQRRPGEVMTETGKEATALRNLGRVSSISRDKTVKHQVGHRFTQAPTETRCALDA